MAVGSDAVGRPIKHYDDPKKERSAERRRERERRYMSKPEVRERRKEYMKAYQREHRAEASAAVKRSRLRKAFKENDDGDKEQREG